MALTPTEIGLLEKHKTDLDSRSSKDELMLRYYRGQQRVEQLGMAIPPAMRKFLMIANWPRTVVDTINARQQIRSLILPGEESADPDLQEIANASNLAVHFSMFNVDRQVYGRGILSVGTNELDAARPLIRAESPREMSVFVDVRLETVTSAARFYGTSESGISPTNATLYLPNVTVWLGREEGTGRWVELDRDAHNLGVVPVVLHLNRRMSGSWVGESQMSDIIPLTDGCARSLTNLQFAQEAHGIPRMFMTGVAKGDFMDADGKPIPQFEAYFDAIHMVSDPQGKVGQLEAADLKNFETALTIYGKQAAIVTGFPARYFGLLAANPPTEGSIRADEATLTRSIEEQNEQVGTSVGSAAALALRFATGEWVKGKRVRTDWFDPSTPTVSQRAEAIFKLATGDRPILSREGAWDELGWSEERKERERQRFEAEAQDTLLSSLLRPTAPADAELSA